MPRNVRNVWIDVRTTDGTRAKPCATGPVTKEGGADVTIYVRREGSVYAAGYITARRIGDDIAVTWRPERGDDVTLYTGPRD